MTEWSELSFAELSRRYENLVSGIRNDLATLAEIGPALTDKAAALGVGMSLDYTGLAAAAQGLVGASRRATTRRGPQSEKPRRYALIFADGTPVTENGQPLRFANRVQILRGPKYETLVGDRIDDVRLVDTEANNAVVHSSLRLGPAPGAPAEK